jgi:2,4-dienoyl-CoA reductase-like NADH-dependent reductase (Old Yellow Enzyme family)
VTGANPVATPLTLPSGLTLQNRLAKAAMSENLGTSDGAPTERLVTLYDRLGRGGAGLLITGNAIVDPGGRTERHNVVMVRGRGDAIAGSASPRGTEALAVWARAAKAHGSAVFMQLSHAGRQTSRMVTWRPVAPSAVALTGKGGLFATPKALTLPQIERLVERFAHAATMAKAAGFDGVQIHGAHGYLVSQFLSPLTNLRTDRYGGDLDGRMRFLLEVVRATRSATGPGFTVAVKLNSADFQRGGFSLEESMEVACALEAAGIDLLEISGGSYEKPAMMGSQVRASTRAREAFFLEYAVRMREVVKLPLMVTGGFRSRAAMNEAIAAGATDVVGLARPLALEPDLPAALVGGRAEAAADHHVGVRARALDDVLQVEWYQQQLVRMAAGREPDPALGRWSTILRALGRSYLEVLIAGARRDGHMLDVGDPAARPAATEAS